MNISKILKVIGAIVAIAGAIAGIYFLVQKLTDKKEPEYFNDDDFFECSNDLEVIEVEDEKKEETETAKTAEAPKKKKAAKKADK